MSYGSRLEVDAANDDAMSKLLRSEGRKGKRKDGRMMMMMQ